MKTEKQPSLKKPEILFLSFMGVGFIPKAPGTFGSIATMPFLYLLGLFHPPFFFFIPFILILTGASCYIADAVQREYKLHDPQWIVIDEVIGMMVTWLFINQHNLLHLFVQLILFRIFDIIKIWPASYFDQKVDHGAGTIIDDVVSGIYAGLSYKIITFFISF